MARIFVAVVILIPCRFVAGESQVWPGERVPSLSDVRWIRGDPVPKFEEGRIFVIEFWSTWCAACVDSIERLNELARQHVKDATFISIHIWPLESAAMPAAFLEKRLSEGKPIMEFSVAEDSRGETAAAWMEATQCTGLPTVMIVDRSSKLVWFGHARDLEKRLKEIVEGSFDVARNLEEMNRRIHVGLLAKQSDSAIEKGQYEKGIERILEAFDADAETVADWLPGTYGHVLSSSRSREIAGKFLESVLAKKTAMRKDLFSGFASVILHFRPKDLRDLDLALRLARRADEMSRERDPEVGSLIAILRAELGDVAGAVQELELAISNATNENARKVLSETMRLIQDRK